MEKTNKKETNSRVWKLQQRSKIGLNCDICPPNRGCNSPRSAAKRNHGQKPRYKDKQ